MIHFQYRQDLPDPVSRTRHIIVSFVAIILGGVSSGLGYSFFAALYEAAEVFCNVITILAAYLADDGTVTIKENFTAQFKVELVRRFCVGVEKGQFRRTVRNGKQKFVIEAPMCTTFIAPVTACTLQGNTAQLVDGDYAKLIISHARKMIL